MAGIGGEAAGEGLRLPVGEEPRDGDAAIGSAFGFVAVLEPAELGGAVGLRLR